MEKYKDSQLAKDFTKILLDLQNKRNDAEYEWIKGTLIMKSWLLGILVSFHKTDSTNCLSALSFNLTIGTLSLGILSGLIWQFARVYVFEKQVKGFLKQWRETNDEDLENEVSTAEPSQPFVLARIVFFLCCVLSIAFVFIYAIN